LKGLKISKNNENDLYFSNIIPFGLIGHTYNLTFNLNPHFYIDKNMFNMSNKIYNEQIDEDGAMDIIIPMTITGCKIGEYFENISSMCNK